MGSGNNRGKLPNTAKNVGEKVVPSVRNEAQSLRTTKETIQPNNKAPGELYYLVFCDDVTCRKTPKKDGSREYKEREAVRTGRHTPTKNDQEYPPGVALPCPPPFIRCIGYWETVGPKQRSLSALTPGGTL